MDRLEERAEALRRRLAEYEALLESALEDPTLVYLGDNYFASMSRADAKAFLTRKIESLRGELSALDQLSGVGEDGLPIFDIVEELDDNGEIVNSNLKRTGLGAQQNPPVPGITTPTHMNFGQEQHHAQSKPLPRDLPSNVEITEQIDHAADVNSTIGSDYEHVESLNASPQADIQYIEDVTSDASQDGADASVLRASEDSSQGEYRDIDSTDILELELLEDSDDGQVDFDFNDIEEEDESIGNNVLDYGSHSDDSGDNTDTSNEDDDENADDDEDDDGFAFGWQGGSLFPQDEATMKLIQAHLAQQAQATSGSDPSVSSQTPQPTTPTPDAAPSKAASKSHVHFAETVDVREFETSASERKSSLFDRKPSRFRAARSKGITVAPRASIEPAVLKASPTSKSVAAAAAAAAGAAAGGAQRGHASRQSPSASPIHGAVRERAAPAPQLATSPTTTRQRNTPQPSLASVRSKTASKALPAKPVVKEHTQTKGPQNLKLQEPQAGADASRGHKGGQDNASKSSIKPGAQQEVPQNASKKDLIAERARELFENSFIPDNEFLKLHDATEPGEDADPEHSAQGATQPGASTPQREKRGQSEQKPIVSSLVEEREPVPAEDSADESDDNTPNMREIKHEYQRLRQKLIYESGGFKKKESERAIEPIEENGAPRKVSRFKAARVAS